MQDRKSKKRAVGVFFAVAAMGTLCLMGIGYRLRQMREPVLARWDQINVWDSEARVRQLLGEPFLECTPNMQSDCKTRRGRRDVQPASGKVLIYHGADMEFILYLTEAGIVRRFERDPT